MGLGSRRLSAKGHLLENCLDSSETLFTQEVSETRYQLEGATTAQASGLNGRHKGELRLCQAKLVQYGGDAIHLLSYLRPIELALVC